MTETMHAVVSHEDGTLEWAEVPKPQPLANEVLIEVTAAGVNPVDWKTSSRLRPTSHLFAPDRPMIVGWDVAGTVADKGMGTSRFAIGDRVCGMPHFPRPAYAYAEYVTAPSRQVAKVPDSVSDVEAGALPLAGLTAWQAIVDTAKVGNGDRVLINAASGGVGHLAVQIAKARGAEVWATGSSSKHATLLDLGADHVIDHHAERFENVCSELDAVFDCYATDGSPGRAVSALRRGGVLVAVSPAEFPSADELDAAGVTANWILVEADYVAIETMLAMMDAGDLRVLIADTRPLPQMAELHELGQASTPVGKLVATVD